MISTKEAVSTDERPYADWKLMPFITVYDSAADMTPVDPSTIADVTFELIQTTVTYNALTADLNSLFTRSSETYPLASCNAADLFTEEERSNFKTYDTVNGRPSSALCPQLANFDALSMAGTAQYGNQKFLSLRVTSAAPPPNYVFEVGVYHGTPNFDRHGSNDPIVYNV